MVTAHEHLHHSPPASTTSRKYFLNKIQEREEEFRGKEDVVFGLVGYIKAGADISDVLRSKDHCSFYPTLAKMTSVNPCCS